MNVLNAGFTQVKIIPIFVYLFTTYISQSNDASNDFVIYLQFALFL